MAATLINRPPVPCLYCVGSRTSRLDTAGRASEISPSFITVYGAAAPPFHRAVLSDRYAEHQEPEEHEPNPGPAEGESPMQRVRNQPIDELDVDPVDEQGRAAEQLERAPALARRLP